MWKIIQCAVQGKGHLKHNIPCQDKTCYEIKDDVAVTALADGAGSAKLSHHGANHITQYICNDLAVHFDDYFGNADGVAVKTELNQKIKHQIVELAKELKCEPHDLASTLLAVAVKGNRYILLHIGDGVIGYSKDGALHVASLPENGEFANTTIFTTSKETLQTMRLMKGQLGTIDGFVLMSDGTEASLYHKREHKLADVLQKIMQMLIFIPEEKVEAQLAESFDSVIRDATTDDCSISIMVNNHAFPGYQALDAESRKKLLHIRANGRTDDRQLRRYDKMLILLKKPHTLSSISRKIHLKPRYAKRHLSKLIRLNLIEKQDASYHTILIL